MKTTAMIDLAGLEPGDLLGAISAKVYGFIDLVLDLWGEAGRHARAAPSVAALPFDIPIVVEALASASPLRI